MPMPDNPSLAKHPALDDWLSIGADGRVRVRSGKVDIGQRISTAVALVAAAELEVDFARIEMEPVETGRSPDEPVCRTGFTSSIRCGTSSATSPAPT